MILELEKSMALAYSLFLSESSNDYLYENIFSMMEDSFDAEREIYNNMFRLGLIDLVKVADDKRENLINCLNEFLND